MYIKFTKDHPSGIKAGTVAYYPTQAGAELVSKGLATLSNEAEYAEWRKQAKAEYDKKRKEEADKAIAGMKEREAKALEEANRPKPQTEIEQLRAELADAKAALASVKTDSARTLSENESLRAELEQIKAKKK